jgi:hypothetical protein
MKRRETHARKRRVFCFEWHGVYTLIENVDGVEFLGLVKREKEGRKEGRASR